MVTIYNLVVKEWDNKGAHPEFHRLRRWAWNNLAQAKNHVATVLSNNYRSASFYEIIAWYLCANFLIETHPKGDATAHEYANCSGYVRRWLADHERMIRCSSTPEVVKKIEALGVWKENTK